MKDVLLVALGGAIGSGARYLVASWVEAGAEQWEAIQTTTGAPPAAVLGTVAVNAIGSFALGALLGSGADPQLLPPSGRLLLGTGLLGGFTTYSTFNLETLRFFHFGHPWLGLAHILGTLMLCLVCGFAGLLVSRAITPR